MTELDETKLSKAISEGVCKALNEEVKAFYVDRETHYQDHKFLGEFRKWIEDIKSTITKTVVKIIVFGLIALVVLGFIFWGSKNL